MKFVSKFLKISDIFFRCNDIFSVYKFAIFCLIIGASTDAYECGVVGCSMICHDPDRLIRHLHFHEFQVLLVGAISMMRDGQKKGVSHLLEIVRYFLQEVRANANFVSLFCNDLPVFLFFYVDSKIATVAQARYATLKTCRKRYSKDMPTSFVYTLRAFRTSFPSHFPDFNC